MSTKGYLIGEQLVGRIKDTIARVDSMPQGGGITAIPTRFETPPAYVPRVFKICTFTGAWAIDTDKHVTFRGVTVTPNTVLVTNILYDLPDQGELPCGVAKDGTTWYLITVKHTTADVITNVTLGSEGLVFTKTRIQVVSTASASTVSIGTTACS